VSFLTYTQLTALLALFANALTLALIIVFAGARGGVGSLVGARDWLRQAFKDVGVWLAWTVATVSTAGSLIYSDHYNLLPCRFCWYQRIAMYPLVVILLIAAIKKVNSEARRYGLPLAAIGIVISGYHYLIQQFPDLEAGACSLSVPCSAPYVWKYDFISIPYMALAGFLLISALLLVTDRE
jgi:disulfide bond formation protein DsbB